MRKGVAEELGHRGSVRTVVVAVPVGVAAGLHVGVGVLVEEVVEREDVLLSGNLAVAAVRAGGIEDRVPVKPALELLDDGLPGVLAGHDRRLVRRAIAAVMLVHGALNIDDVRVIIARNELHGVGAARLAQTLAGEDAGAGAVLAPEVLHHPLDDCSLIDSLSALAGAPAEIDVAPVDLTDRKLRLKAFRDERLVIAALRRLRLRLHVEILGHGDGRKDSNENERHHGFDHREAAGAATGWESLLDEGHGERFRFGKDRRWGFLRRTLRASLRRAAARGKSRSRRQPFRDFNEFPPSRPT